MCVDVCLCGCVCVCVGVYVFVSKCVVVWLCGCVVDWRVNASARLRRELRLALALEVGWCNDYAACLLSDGMNA